MGRPVRVIKAEAYREVAAWLEEFAAKMQKEAEATAFEPRVHTPVLRADGVKGLAKDLRKRANQIEKRDRA